MGASFRDPSERASLPAMQPVRTGPAGSVSQRRGRGNAESRSDHFNCGSAGGARPRHSSEPQERAARSRRGRSWPRGRARGGDTSPGLVSRDCSQEGPAPGELTREGAELPGVARFSLRSPKVSPGPPGSSLF
ncbi:uncharacterized protein LOC144376944 [Ictidomys tridecemlineatus]